MEERKVFLQGVEAQDAPPTRGEWAGKARPQHDVPPVFQFAPSERGWMGRMRAIIGGRLVEVVEDHEDLTALARRLSMLYLRKIDGVGRPHVADPPLHYHDRPIPAFDHPEVVRLHRDIEP